MLRHPNWFLDAGAFFIFLWIPIIIPISVRWSWCIRTDVIVFLETRECLETMYMCVLVHFTQVVFQDVITIPILIDSTLKTQTWLTRYSFRRRHGIHTTTSHEWVWSPAQLRRRPGEDPMGCWQINTNQCPCLGAETEAGHHGWLGWTLTGKMPSFSVCVCCRLQQQQPSIVMEIFYGCSMVYVEVDIWYRIYLFCHAGLLCLVAVELGVMRNAMSTLWRSSDEFKSRCHLPGWPGRRT